MMYLFAGRASAQQVKTDYDRSANFGQYHTYSWERVKTLCLSTELRTP
jgi:hypothetical protein